MTKDEKARLVKGVGEQVECCRCGWDIHNHYYLTESASPAHWECLTDEEQIEQTWLETQEEK